MPDYYRRSKIAADARHISYEKALTQIRMNFVGEVGEAVYEYITTLHRRIGNRPPWDGVMFFDSWDYGSPRPVGKHGFMIRVWQKSASTYPDDINPNIEITVNFTGLTVEVEAVARGSATLFSQKAPLDITPSSLGLNIGAGWEKLLTGSVDYGD